MGDIQLSHRFAIIIPKGGGLLLSIILDKYDFDIVLACFWHNEEGKWEGVIKDNLNTTEAKVIMSDKIILIIKLSA